MNNRECFIELLGQKRAPPSEELTTAYFSIEDPRTITQRCRVLVDRRAPRTARVCWCS
jgi:hypothetical protein